MSVENTNPVSGTRLIVVMGTTGCGKSTIGGELSVALDAVFLEGDDFHSDENRAKMTAGTALTDADRWPWLMLIGNAMSEAERITVVSCSSLKRAYRDYLREVVNKPVLFVHLNGSRELLASRLTERKNHFMNTDLLESQLSTLEPLDASESGFSVDIDASVDQLIGQIKTKLANQSWK